MNTTARRSFRSLQKFFLKTITFSLLVLQTQQAFAQFTDNFDDGNFASNPLWQGADSKFIVSSGRLKLQAPAVTDVGYLSVNSQAINNALWEFFVRIEFNPSSSNYARVYLVSDKADLTSSLNGYFVAVGSTSDEISLYRQTGLTTTKIIDGVDNRLNLSTTDMKIKVTRDDAGNWSLYTDVSVTGTYVSEGNAADLNTLSSTYFGVYCFYSSTRSDKFYFDDFVVTGDSFVDHVSPTLQSVSVLSSTKLLATFSEALDPTEAQNTNHYFVADIGNPTNAVLQSDPTKVEITFTESFRNGATSSLAVTGVLDVAGNGIIPVEKSFLYFQASPVSYRDIIITEFFPDYTPKIGLPEAEFIEIFNRSTNPIDLANWKITDGSSTGILSSTIILPDDYVILSAATTQSLFNNFGKTIGVTNFPTLNNNGDFLLLKDNNDQAVDSLRYTLTWYGDEDKSQGGWTLERMDPENVCKGDDNWKASTNESGGTPGRINSVNQIITDVDGAVPLHATQISDQEVQITFDEKLDQSTPLPSQIVFSPSLSISDIEFSDASLKTLKILLSESIEDERTYLISMSDIFDCTGNRMEDQFRKIYLNLDTIPPAISSVKVLTANSIIVTYTERVNSAENIAKYHTQSRINPEQVLINDDRLSVKLVFARDFENGVEQKLFIDNVADVNGNILHDSVAFVYFKATPVTSRDIIITEIFPDPSPVVGLPEAEFVELYNRSANPIQLANWKLTDGSSSTVFPNKIILPGEYFIVTASSSLAAYSPFGKTIGTSAFPSLNNSGDNVILKDSAGLTIDSIHYTLAWYHDTDKKNGGWTLERINYEDACHDIENWTASNDTVFGGTPGRINAVFSDLPDTEGPKLLSVNWLDSVTVEMQFNEKLDGSLLPDFVEIQPNVVIDSVRFSDATFSSIRIFPHIALNEKRTYQFIVKEMSDCSGNGIDNLYNTAYLHLDTIPPGVEKLSIISNHIIAIKFAEEIQKNFNTNNFSAHGVNPKDLSVNNAGDSVTLTFENDFVSGVEQQLIINNVQDINGNSIHDLEVSFMFFEEKQIYPNDIVLTEIFPDPSPVIGLPEAEFVEVFNRTTNPVSLQNWILTDGSSIGKILTGIVMPGEYAILCTSSVSNNYKPFGKTLSVTNFPSLNNSGDILVLKNNTGLVIDSVNYNESWYRDENVSEGGYTLELIDTENLCAEEENWTASESEIGGTPGRQNSVLANKPDLTSPELVSAIPDSDHSLIVLFNEKLDRQVPSPSSFEINDMEIVSVSFSKPDLREIRIKTGSAFESGKNYRVIASNIYDCAGNEISADKNFADFGLPETPQPGEILINEVLFNPRPTGVDFIELYNNSDKYFNLKNLQLANVENDTLKNFKQVSESNILLAPEEYLVLTSDAVKVKSEYPRTNDQALFATKSLPSMNDDEGYIAIADTIGNIIDDFHYTDDYHSVFLRDDEGVSLERVSFSEETNSSSNWKSASEESGFATPGYVNSNAIHQTQIEEGVVVVEPEIFDPNSSSITFTTVNYHFDKGGFIGNVKVYDPQGREVKNIAENQLLGTEGFFRWDGDENNGTKARIGTYMIWLQIFDAEGTLQTFRKEVVVAGQFK